MSNKDEEKYLKYKIKYFNLKGSGRLSKEKIKFANEHGVDIEPDDEDGDTIFESFIQSLDTPSKVKPQASTGHAKVKTALDFAIEASLRESDMHAKEQALIETAKKASLLQERKQESISNYNLYHSTTDSDCLYMSLLSALTLKPIENKTLILELKKLILKEYENIIRKYPMINFMLKDELLLFNETSKVSTIDDKYIIYSLIYGLNNTSEMGLLDEEKPNTPNDYIRTFNKMYGGHPEIRIFGKIYNKAILCINYNTIIFYRKKDNLPYDNIPDKHNIIVINYKNKDYNYLLHKTDHMIPFIIPDNYFVISFNYLPELYESTTIPPTLKLSASAELSIPPTLKLSASAELPIPPISNIFYIYTTGLFDNSNIKLLDLWLDTLCNNITSCIPDRFQRIEILHYNNATITPNSKELGVMREKLMARHRLDKRIMYHKFINEILPYDQLKNPHIVIDMAHIFNYYPNEQNKYDVFLSTDKSQCPLPIKSIYIGLKLANKELFIVTKRNTVITFIDILIHSKIITKTEKDPSKVLDDIETFIIEKLRTEWDSDARNPGKFVELIQTFDIFDCIYNKLLNQESIEKIKDFTNYPFYIKFLENL